MDNAVDLVNHKGKNISKTQDTLDLKLDSLFYVLKYEFPNIKTFEDNDCNDNCTKKAHI